MSFRDRYISVDWALSWQNNGYIEDADRYNGAGYFLKEEFSEFELSSCKA